MQVSAGTVRHELIAMIPEEDEVTLVMEGDNLPSVEVGVLGEECYEHTTDALTCHCVEVVHDQLWWVVMTSGASVVGNVISQLYTADAECRSGSLWQMRDDQGVRVAMLFIPEQQVGVTTFDTPLDDVLHLKILSFVVLHRG